MKKRDVLRFPQRATKSLPELNLFPLVVCLADSQSPRKSELVRVTQFRLAHILLMEKRYVKAITEKSRRRALRMLAVETLVVLQAMWSHAIIEKGALIPLVDEISISWARAYVLKIVPNKKEAVNG